MLYHEVSHAILTPTDKLNADYKTNVMEDERIETSLRDFYLGVDFRKQLYDIHGGHAPKATNSNSAYFNAVRFGLGTARVQAKVNQILKDYATINRTASYDKCCAYSRDIEQLYRMVSTDYADNPEEFQPKSNGAGQNGESQQSKQMDSFGQSGKDENNSKQQNGGTSEGKENSDGNESENGNPMMDDIDEGDPHHGSLSKEQMEKLVGNSMNERIKLSKSVAENLESFRKSAEMIIGNFNKKNKGGSGINAYSGVFNPRAVARNDYRYFERPMTTQGNNKFGTCHLNLIIDCSGSYYNNVDVTNGILMVLSDIERKNRNFSMDVGFINHNFRMCEKVSDRRMYASGGNRIPNNMKDILLDLQKPQTCNYNIILFDGDALSDDNTKNPQKKFGVFDMKQTTLITDPDNEYYMKTPFTSTKVVVTHDYTKELMNNVLHALTIAFG